MKLENPKSFACELDPSQRDILETSYVCKLSCASNNTCQYLNEDVLDGTWCGQGKVCLFFKCINVEPKNGDKFINENHIIPKSLRNDQHNLDKLEYSAQLLGSLCPFGASNAKYHLENPIRERWFGILTYDNVFGFDLIEKAQTCENFFKTYRDESNDFCTNEHATKYVCCEKCIQYNMAKTIQYSMKINGKVKCESFTKMPCYNDGICVNIEESDLSSNASFKCECKKGYSGRKERINYKFKLNNKFVYSLRFFYQVLV